MKIILVSLLLGILVFTNAKSCKSLNEHAETVRPIVQAMTLEEKIGQMCQADVLQAMTDNKIDPSIVSKYNLGSLLVGGNCVPGPNGELFLNPNNKEEFAQGTQKNWKKLADSINVPTKVSTVHGQVEVYPLLGTDAVHGNQHVVGEVLFPHNIGLAATHDMTLFRAIGYHMAKSVKESGWNFAFAPTVAVSHNYQWGRSYETLGTDPTFIKDYAREFVLGAQMPNDYTGKWEGVLASVKHFIGDGSTYLGLDKGNSTVHNFKAFKDVNMAGYHGGIEACAGNVMCSYSAVNNIHMSLNAELIERELKEQAGFEGFVISDYDEIAKLSDGGYPSSNIKLKDQAAALIGIINSGVDMMMLAGFNNVMTLSFFRDTLLNAVQNGEISRDRIDDAVTRILQVKVAMGLIREAGTAPEPEPEKRHDMPEAWETAQEAAEKSFVLLENADQTLPANLEDYTHIVLVGERKVTETNGNYQTVPTIMQDFDNIGAQNGGWSVGWQGYNGNYFWKGNLKDQSHASSILDALLARVDTHKTKILYPKYSNPEDMNAVQQARDEFKSQIEKLRWENTRTLVIGVMAEDPYAEFMGDVNNPFCYGTTAHVEGCNYNLHFNSYLPQQQKTELRLEYDEFSQSVLQMVRKDPSAKFVHVLLHGRPLVVDTKGAPVDALVAAWLPGTSGGEAIARALTGEYRFGQRRKANTLPVEWLSDMESLQGYPIYKKTLDGRPEIPRAKYPAGYGLSTVDKKAITA